MNACRHVVAGTRDAPENMNGNKMCWRSSRQEQGWDGTKKKKKSVDMNLHRVLQSSSIKGDSGIISPSNMTAYHDIENVKFWVSLVGQYMAHFSEILPQPCHRHLVMMSWMMRHLWFSAVYQALSLVTPPEWVLLDKLITFNLQVLPPSKFHMRDGCVSHEKISLLVCVEFCLLVSVPFSFEYLIQTGFDITVIDLSSNFFPATWANTTFKPNSAI